MVIYLLNNITTIVSEHDWNCSVWSAWKCYETSNVILIYVNMRYSSYWFVPMVHEEILVYMNPGSLLFETYFINAGQTWKYFPSRAFHGFMAASAWDVGISLAGSIWLSRRSVLSCLNFPFSFAFRSSFINILTSKVSKCLLAQCIGQFFAVGEIMLTSIRRIVPRAVCRLFGVVNTGF